MDTQIRTRGAAWAQTVKEEQDLRGYTWEHQHDTYPAGPLIHRGVRIGPPMKSTAHSPQNLPKPPAPTLSVDGVPLVTIGLWPPLWTLK